ncbi:glycosyltransferase [Niabella sp. CC-SYL272]|uniref:glycosyltransferase family 2 protein n=1 Tax=Niabella agricola TaxID=2891571 RepID=UPI001F409424|nr:glycosyltransferase [Niabella agricola]MCF3109937.1 glycosyltransferase [Niabella agricola]
MEGEDLLVSIIIITYNSGDYVLETLDSVKEQTYQNIELIISDDGSFDDTVTLCEKWLSFNMERFVRTKLLVADQNRGIPANCNNGIKSSSGSIVKLLAGDDVFYNTAIEDCVKLFKTSRFDLLQTNATVFKGALNAPGMKDDWVAARLDRLFFELAPRQQYKVLKYRNFLHAPGVFFNSDIFKKIQFDEDFALIEDYPFWIMAAKGGLRISYSTILTVKYRIHDQSVQYTGKPFASEKKINMLSAILSKYYSDYQYSLSRLNHLCYILLDRMGANVNNKLSRTIYSVLENITRFSVHLYMKWLLWFSSSDSRPITRKSS